MRNAQQETGNARQQVHSLLHAAEQALAAGQLQAARAAADGIKKLKTAAGTLPKPTTQRLGRLVQQLVELERWESFGQQNARVQLCERAEALAAQTLDAPQLAIEVQKLRNEWKALDQQHAGVPKSLWERFDGACEKAYAPAARHFAEQAALRKQSRKQRDEFIAAAAAHATGLLAEPRDWRAIERWLRDTDQQWREGNLGSVEPRAWKKVDAQMKAALAPLRDALAAARDAGESRPQGVDRGSHRAGGQGDGARYARAGEGAAGEMAGAGQSALAAAARRAPAVGSVSRRLRCGVRRTPEQAQGRGQPQR